MKFKFTGTYTNGHTSINACGVVFTGTEPAEVTGEDAIARLSRHPEFERVDSLDHDGDGAKGGSLPGAKATARKPRKPKKAAQ